MINGPFILRTIAKFVANLYEINPVVVIEWGEDDRFSECAALEDGTYQITISPWIRGETLIEVIGHEITHVWQYETRRLIMLHEVEKYVWLDKTYDQTGFMEDYLLTPWEMEARGREYWVLWKWRNRRELH